MSQIHEYRDTIAHYLCWPLQGAVGVMIKRSCKRFPPLQIILLVMMTAILFVAWVLALLFFVTKWVYDRITGVFHR